MLIHFDQLFPRHRVCAQVAVHLGAHYGEEAPFYHGNGVRKVIWVEALPECFEELVRRVSGKFPQDEFYQACLSNVDRKPVTFNVANNEGQSSSFLEFGTHTKEHPTVKFTRKVEMLTIRADSFLGDIGIPYGSFLNLDLQGAELLALEGLGALLNSFSYVYCEVNERELYKGCALVGEIDAYLGGFGFRGVETKMTNFGWGDKFYIKHV